LGCDPSNTCGIYSIINKATGQRYIGLTRTTFARRWRGHISSLNRSVHANQDLQRDWLELGCGGFDFAIVEAFPQNISHIVGLKALERRYISSSEPLLYNATVDIPRYADGAFIAELYADKSL
jgi:hypothetical protein